MINHSVYYSTTPVVRELDACTPRLLSRGRYRGRPTVSSGPACTASYVECRASSRPCRGASHGHRKQRKEKRAHTIARNAHARAAVLLVRHHTLLPGHLARLSARAMWEIKRRRGLAPSPEMPRSERMESRRERRYCWYGTTFCLPAIAGTPVPRPAPAGGASGAMSGRSAAAAPLVPG